VKWRNANRDYEAGLEFTVGAGQMIAGFDAGVVGMKLGETKTLKIPADQAYGQKKDELIRKIPLEQVGDLSGVSVGTQVLLGGKIPATITEITDKDITVEVKENYGSARIAQELKAKGYRTIRGKILKDYLFERLGGNYASI